MQKIEEEKLLELYTLAEIAYNNHFQNAIDNKDYLYPEGWYENQNYKLKLEIITEAIKNNILIENTTKYQESIECVKSMLIKG